jgi:predicted amidohydrolase
MNPGPFKLALAQITVTGGDKNRNLTRAEDCIARAAKEGAACVLLPEALDLGWTHPASATEAEPIPQGACFQRLSAAAVAGRVYVCSGLVERSGVRVYNSAVLIDPQGRLLLLHRKLNELEIGFPYYAQGDRMSVCETPLGTIGLMICADGFAKDHVLSRTLGYLGADLILSPCAWAVPADHDNLREPYGKLWRDSYVPVAREYAMWIAGVSNVGWLTAGPWQGRKCIGCSLVIGPDGAERVFGPYGVHAETILYVDITPRARPARGNAWANWSPGSGIDNKLWP